MVPLNDVDGWIVWLFVTARRSVWCSVVAWMGVFVDGLRLVLTVMITIGIRIGELINYVCCEIFRPHQRVSLGCTAQ